MTPQLLVLSWIWIVCFAVSYRYFRSLFMDLTFRWSIGNRVCCLALCIAGPAALVCGLAVDYSRPLA
jgi:hypothetical protein